MKKIKYVKKADMWAHITITRQKDGKLKQEMKWFTTRKKAEEYDNNTNKTNINQ